MPTNKKHNSNKKNTAASRLAKVLAATMVVSSVVSTMPAELTFANQAAALSDVNSAATAADMKTALEAPALALTLTQYQDLSTTNQTKAAEAVLAGRGASYGDVASVQAALDQAVASLTLDEAMDVLNAANSIAAMRAALEASVLGLDLAAYYNLSVTDRLTIAEYILEKKPANGGYSNLAAVQTQLDAILPQMALLEDVKALDIKYYEFIDVSNPDKNEVDSAIQVTRNLTLPTTGLSGSVVTWSSDNEDIIANDGKVNRPAFYEGDAVVVMTATLELNGMKMDKIFVLRVVSEAPNNEDIVKLTVQTLKIKFGTGDSISGVTQDLTLPLLGENDSVIEWSSDEESIIEVDNLTGQGYVNRPTASIGDKAVTLTAQITKGQHQASKTFVVKVLKQAQTDSEAVANAKSALDIDYSSSDSALHVTEALNLPTTGADGTTIVWSSSNTIIVAADGTVTRPANQGGDQVVVLTATITKGQASTTKNFVVKVAKKDITDQEVVDAAASLLTIGYTGQDTAAAVTQGITLPATGVKGTTIQWSSSSPIITQQGQVTRPSFTVGDQAVTLTATVNLNGVTAVKTFTLKVLRQQQTDAEAVSTAKAALELGFANGNSVTNVTNNLVLPSAGNEGTAVTWSSSNQAVISNSGIVNRPISSEGDTVVVLTATISKNGAQDTKSFVVKVLKVTGTDLDSVRAAATDLAVAYQQGDSFNSVTQNISLPTAGLHGTTINWTSDHSSVSSSGVVTRPSHTAGDQMVTLVATISKNGESVTKSFLIKVVKQSKTDAEAVAIAAAALDLGLAFGDNPGGITQQLNLTTNGSEGTTITWSSDQTAIIANNGTVNRPSFAEGDQLVELTATISKNGVSATKSFVVKVLKQGSGVTPAPLPANIMIFNHPAGTQDLITVHGVNPGDLVKVYHADGGAVLGQGTVVSGADKIELLVPQLGEAGGSVKITVTRQGYTESTAVTKHFAAENVRPYTITNGSISKDKGIKATVTIQPTEGLTLSGKKYVVFQLMNGTTPEGILVLEYKSTSAGELTAHFNKSGSGYSVKVFVVDAYGTDLGSIGASMAEPVTLQ